MSAHKPPQARLQRPRIYLFRALGGVLLAFSIVALAAAGIGIYYTVKESSVSGWLAPLLVGGIGIAACLMIVVGARALRVKSIEELEEQSKSIWLDS